MQVIVRDGRFDTDMPQYRQHRFHHRFADLPGEGDIDMIEISGENMTVVSFSQQSTRMPRDIHSADCIITVIDLDDGNTRARLTLADYDRKACLAQD